MISLSQLAMPASVGKASYSLFPAALLLSSCTLLRFYRMSWRPTPNTFIPQPLTIWVGLNHPFVTRLQKYHGQAFAAGVAAGTGFPYLRENRTTGRSASNIYVICPDSFSGFPMNYACQLPGRDSLYQAAGDPSTRRNLLINRTVAVVLGGLKVTTMRPAAETLSLRQYY